MAQIELRLSNKIQQETGMSEVMVCLRYSKHDLYAKSGIFVNPAFFEYYIDRKKTRNPRLPLPENKNTATMAKAVKNGWALRKSGFIVVFSDKGILTDEKKKHNAKAKKMEELKESIISAYYDAADKESLTSVWLTEIVDKYHHPEKYDNKPKEMTFYELCEEFLTKPHGRQQEPIAESHARVYRVLVRTAARYEGFVRETDKERRRGAG